MRVARRHDDRGEQLGAVDETDAAHPRPLAQDGVDRALGAQDTPGSLERGEQRPRHLAAASDRTPDGADVAHRGGERTEPGPGGLRRDSPHHGAVERGGPEHGVVVEVAAQHVGGAATRPPQQRRCSGELAAERDTGQPAHRRRFAGRVEHHADRRHRRLGVSPVAVGLVGHHRRERVDGRLDVVEVRPELGRFGPRHVVLGRLDVEVPESVVGQPEFVDHRRRAEGQVIAVADVHRGAAERLAGRGTARRRSGPRAAACADPPREVGGGDQTVVAGTDHDRIPVPAIPAASHPSAQSLALTCRPTRPGRRSVRM